MDAMTKTRLKAQVSTLVAMNQAFKASVGMAVPPVMAGAPPMPVMIEPALGAHLSALRKHADDYDKMLQLLSSIIDGI